MGVSDRIRKYIDEQGFRYNKVAERSGIDAKRFYRLINAKTAMTVEDYEQICKKGLSIDPGFFLKKSS